MQYHILVIISLFLSISGISYADNFKNVKFRHDFQAQVVTPLNPLNDRHQCNNVGEDDAPFGRWTKKIRLNTDNRPGGCFHKFTIYDPDKELRDLELSFNWFPDGEDAGQCGGYRGEQDVPFSDDEIIEWTKPILIDTDDRHGGCKITWEIKGRRDIGLQIDFEADGKVGQCGGHGVKHVVSYPSKVTLRYNMDGRAGGCWLKFRLIKI